MAAMQLSGSGVLVKRNLPSLEGLRLLPSMSRVSSVCWARAEVFPVSKIDNINTRKMSVSMCLNERGTSTPGFEANSALKYIEDEPEQFIDEPAKSYPTANEKLGMDVHVHDEGVPQQRKGAKLHDFCLGIPFGGIVFVGGLVGFVLSRNPASLTTGMLIGGAIMALGFSSLKVWRRGRSSLPFILGQAALGATVLWKHFQLYSSTKKLFPSGFYVVMSALMLCFYSYVLISGGNPPPKKKSAVTQLS